MLTPAAMARALRTIETDLRAAVKNADAQHPIDAYEIHVAAIKVGCQAELLEKGLVE